MDNTDKSQQSSLYREVIAFLESRINYETFLSIPYRVLQERLHHLRRLLDFLGSPDENYSVVHISGTKGKGSTSIFLEQILLHADYRVARFTSPHLHSLMERFSINGNPCSEERFCSVFSELKERIIHWEKTDPRAAKQEFRLTYFEWLTVLAFELFAREKVDFAVFEVGLGGRFDSTNICRPIVSVITSISYDHIQQLGPTLKDIATEKAGIIKPNIPVISGVRRNAPRQTIRTIAEKRHCLCLELDADFFFDFSTVSSEKHNTEIFDFTAKIPGIPAPIRYEALSINAVGEHQLCNASVAIAAIETIKSKTLNGHFSEEAIRNGLQAAQLPARIELFSRNPLWIVDGSHNRASVLALISAIRNHYHVSGKKYLLFASMLGKDNEGMLSEIVNFFDWVIFTQCPDNPRAFPAQGLLQIADVCWNDLKRNSFATKGSALTKIENSRKNAGEAIADVRDAMKKLQTLVEPNDLVCTAGSLYLAAIVREILLLDR